MPSREHLHNYQLSSIEFILSNNRCALFLGLGLGKTVTTLTAIDKLMYEEVEIGKVLVIAPKRVAEHTWGVEKDKWDHLRHLRVEKILGTEIRRKTALKAKADIYVINRENIPWLVGYLGTHWPFDMVVIDELSSFKNHDSQRFKALRRVIKSAKRVIGLTGTPAPNGLVDLWSQIYLLDGGERLYDGIMKYRSRFFDHNPWQHKYIPKPEAEKEIYRLISDICISMKAEDYLELPGKVDNIVQIPLGGKIMGQYEKFEEEQILSLAAAGEITVASAAALTNKLLQFCNGAVYDDERNWHEVHREKLEALEEIVEAANGKPVLVFYNFKHDKERVLKHLKAYKAVALEDSSMIDEWNRGEIRVLLAHPASAGHGLNMQEGGNTIVWFGLNWSLELYLQAIGRLHRQGQKSVVINNMLITPGTVEQDVLSALNTKTETQDALMDAVKARIDKYLKLKTK